MPVLHEGMVHYEAGNGTGWFLFRRRKGQKMTFTYRVYYEDDSLWFYGKIRSVLVRAKSPKQAMERFQKLYGIKPLEVKL